MLFGTSVEVCFGKVSVFGIGAQVEVRTPKVSAEVWLALGFDTQALRHVSRVCSHESGPGPELRFTFQGVGRCVVGRECHTWWYWVSRHKVEDLVGSFGSSQGRDGQLREQQSGRRR